MSGGNPFIVDALATAFGDVETQNGNAPTMARARGLASPGIAEWTTVRAAELDPRAPGLLHAVAVLGDDCELRHACALASIAPEDAGEIIDALIDVGIFAPGERLTFAQPAVATALEHALTHGQRAGANLRAARLLADEGEAPDRVARHLLLAPRVNSRDTVETLSVAAAVALSHANPFDAVSFLRRALEEPPPGMCARMWCSTSGGPRQWRGIPAAAHLADGIAHLGDGPNRPEQALSSGRALFALGRGEEALAAFEYGLARNEELDPDTVARLRAAHTTATWLNGDSPPDVLESTVPPATAASAADRALLALHAIGGVVRGLPALEVRALAERALAHGALLDDETSDGPDLLPGLVGAARGRRFPDGRGRAHRRGRGRAVTRVGPGLCDRVAGARDDDPAPRPPARRRVGRAARPRGRAPRLEQRERSGPIGARPDAYRARGARRSRAPSGQGRAGRAGRSIPVLAALRTWAPDPVPR